MKIRFFRILPVLILFSSTGCFDLGMLVSDLPLSPPGTVRADPSLAGIWNRVETEAVSQGPESLRIILFNENEYLIVSGSCDDNSMVRAFVSEISGVKFLNIHDLSSDDREFVFCRYELSPEGNLELNFVSDTCFKEHPPESSKKLLKQIKKNLSNPDLFSREMRITLKRIDPAPLRINKARK